MKIAINATFLSRRLTGVGVFTREVTREILAMAPRTLVFTPYPELFQSFTTCIPTPHRFQGSVTTSNNIGRFLYLHSVLPVLLRRFRVDVLYCPILEYPFLSKLPTVVTVHDLHPIYFPDQFGAAGIHFRAALKWTGKRRDRIIVPSRYVKRELIRLLPETQGSINSISLGYDRCLFQPQAAAQRKRFLSAYGIGNPYILFVGSLFPYKNFQVLLAAFRQIRDRVPQQLLVLGRTEVAPAPPVPELRVRYLDYVPAADLPKFYSYADLYVQPSLAEGFGLTIAEAMACGVPVLASRAGSLPEVVGDAGLLFDPHDSKALAQQMLRTLTDTDLGRQLTKKGYNRVQQFSWRETASGILHVIRQAAGGRVERNRHHPARTKT